MNAKTVSRSANPVESNPLPRPDEAKTASSQSIPVSSVAVEGEADPARSTPLKSAAAPDEELVTESRDYDAVAITNYYRPRVWLVWRRRFAILWPMLKLAFKIWFDRRRGTLKQHELQRAEELREMLTQLGPAFIKVGQALSTRPDLVPPLYLEELAKLQDQLPPFPNEVAYQFIEEELGDRPDRIYAELTPDPVAAASLGQVYKGKLKTGETVAVKVQRPGLAESVALDIYILRELALWAQNNIKQIRSDLVAIADEFAARIYEEMDYTKEGHNAERFGDLYGHLRDIYVPKIYWDYTARRVLTMEWVNGTKLTQLEALKAKGIDAKYLIEVGVQCSLRQLLEHGFFHADPHPGNLLATNDGKLAYLDFGMMSQVKPYQRYGLIEAVVHLVNRDFEGLARDYVKLEFLTEDTDLTPIIPALAGVFNNALGASVAELNFKSITDQLSEVMYEYPFRVPAYYALIIRSLVTLEGIAINVDPNFKVLSKAYPYIAKRLLTDSSPQLRASLRDLLFKDGDFRWNRLENLLRNARSSDDYDLSQALNQALEFLFSERGEFIRERIVEELVKSIDTLSRDAVGNASAVLSEWFGLKMHQPTPASAADTQKIEHIKRIWEILQETRGFDPTKLLQALPPLLMKRETQEMGRQIVNGLAERVVARLIRELLLEDMPAERNGHYNGHKPPLTLPPSSRNGKSA
ncbi:ABC1 kinase family protein [Oxynema aestuarii]|uniref:AarF/ABC1/UbiB kinase family protein n=1 Tax=Oxynema aestuarii AP17 TaxID=2064643 RepID=A0A6H1U1X1_9CYAN|nr:AarF/ABC1/UbiB kinase family protein [Oxynema aestuarii]QIZ72862.1 AarF/ABC1/UbiB kinase family protein [Oxynema aestuarii AP17]